MATTTTNYNLIKPAANDNYDVADFNANFDAIDAQMKANADAASGAASGTHAHGSITNDGKIGTAANKAVYTGEGGALQAGTLPVSAGGTGGTTAAAARAGIGAQAARLTFTDKSVATSAWLSDSTYTDFPYRAAVPCAGVTAAHFAQVALAPDDALGGNLAPVCLSYDGGIYLYAKAVPTATITIPTIVAWG
jgi:hypothetical protein